MTFSYTRISNRTTVRTAAAGPSILRHEQKREAVEVLTGVGKRVVPRLRELAHCGQRGNHSSVEPCARSQHSLRARRDWSGLREDRESMQDVRKSGESPCERQHWQQRTQPPRRMHKCAPLLLFMPSGGNNNSNTPRSSTHRPSSRRWRPCPSKRGGR